MASIRKEPNGKKAILILCPDGKRRTIRLGKCTMESAKEIKGYIERIASARWSNTALSLRDAEWLGGISATLHDRIHRAGLADQREDAVEEKPVYMLGDFLQSYIDKRTDLKESTRKQYGFCRQLMIERLGEQTSIDALTEADAEDWQRWLMETKAPATVSKYSKRAKTMMQYAVKARILAVNPFAELRGGSEVNRDRDHFVDIKTTEIVLASITDPVWRLAFTLARFGGLRVCEILTLTWDDMLWDKSMIRVDSPKTGMRYVPMFSELRPHLDEAFAVAPDGQVRCLSRFAESTTLGPQLTRYIEQAGVTPWKKPFQNLRSTRRTELEEQFPNHVVNKWLGHSGHVADAHYLQVTPDHIKAAISGQLPPQKRGTVSSRT